MAEEPSIDLSKLSRSERTENGGNTQEILLSDWRLYTCIRSSGEEALTDWGPEQAMVRRLKHEADQNRDVWLMSPAGNKYLPDSPDLPPLTPAPKDNLKAGLLQVFGAQRELELDLQVKCDQVIKKWQAKYEHLVLPEVSMQFTPTPCFGGLSRSIDVAAKVTLRPPPAPYKQPSI